MQVASSINYGPDKSNSDFIILRDFFSLSISDEYIHQLLKNPTLSKKHLMDARMGKLNKPNSKYPQNALSYGYETTKQSAIYKEFADLLQISNFNFSSFKLTPNQSYSMALTHFMSIRMYLLDCFVGYYLSISFKYNDANYFTGFDWNEYPSLQNLKQNLIATTTPPLTQVTQETKTISFSLLMEHLTQPGYLLLLTILCISNLRKFFKNLLIFSKLSRVDVKNLLISYCTVNDSLNTYTLNMGMIAQVEIPKIMEHLMLRNTRFLIPFRNGKTPSSISELEFNKMDMIDKFQTEDKAAYDQFQSIITARQTITMKLLKELDSSKEIILSNQQLQDQLKTVPHFDLLLKFGKKTAKEQILMVLEETTGDNNNLPISSDFRFNLSEYMLLNSKWNPGGDITSIGLNDMERLTHQRYTALVANFYELFEYNNNEFEANLQIVKRLGAEIANKVLRKNEEEIKQFNKIGFQTNNNDLKLLTTVFIKENTIKPVAASSVASVAAVGGNGGGRRNLSRRLVRKR